MREGGLFNFGQRFDGGLDADHFRRGFHCRFGRKFNRVFVHRNGYGFRAFSRHGRRREIRRQSLIKAGKRRFGIICGDGRRVSRLGGAFGSNRLVRLRQFAVQKHDGIAVAVDILARSQNGQRRVGHAKPGFAHELSGFGDRHEGHRVEPMLGGKTLSLGQSFLGDDGDLDGGTFA
jgi:hypothetical protein